MSSEQGYTGPTHPQTYGSKDMAISSLDFTEASLSMLSAAVARNDPGLVLSIHIPSYSDRERSGFVSTAKCKERPQAHGLTLSDAHILTMYSSSSDRMDVEIALKGVNRSIERSMEEYRNLFRSMDLFRSTLRDIASSGTMERTKAFRFLNDDRVGHLTQARYARSARFIVIVACRVFVSREKFPKIHISDELQRALQAFLSIDPDDAIAHQERVLGILCAVYFESIDHRYSAGSTSNKNVRGSTSLFASTVVACMCVTGEYPNRLRFKQGTNVLSQISGIMYFASCRALLENNNFILSAELRQEHFKLIRNMMDLKMKGGVQIFIDLRSVRALVRDREAQPPLYYLCPTHPLCGTIRGHELSAAEIGVNVREMKSDLHAVIFDKLLHGGSGPPELRNMCTKLVDNDDNLESGYWALADERNAFQADSKNDGPKSERRSSKRSVHKRKKA